jgi:hypothetical protein
LRQSISDINLSTAVLLLGFKRIDFLKKRLSELSRNQQVPIVISIDGSDFSTERAVTDFLNEFVAQNPDMKITYKIQDMNLGLARHVFKAITEVLNDFEQIIVIEDDIILSENFISNMLGGFEIMNRSEDIGLIGGFSMFPLKTMFFLDPKWRKSIYFPAWGWGINREVWKDFQLELPPNFEEILSHSRLWQSQSLFRKKMWCYRFQKVANANPYTWDYQMLYLLFRRNLHTLLTTSRISDNEGFESVFATNTKNKRPRWMGREMVFNGTVKKQVSKLSRLYQVGDAYTIGGDTRIVKAISQISQAFKFSIRKNRKLT